MAATSPKGGELARQTLFEDLQQLSKGLPDLGISAELKFEVTLGIMIQLMRAIGEGRLSSLACDHAVGAILRAIGLSDREVKSVLVTLPKVAGEAGPDGPRSASARR